MERKIVVLAGGFSSERKISLITSLAVSKEYLKSGYNTYLIDTAYPEKFYLNEEIEKFETKEINSKLSAQKIKILLDTLEKIQPDNIFIGLHGGEGENGQIQALLEMAGYNFIGSGSKASSVGMDKNLTKVIAKYNDIRTADWDIIENNYENILKLVAVKYGYPVVIKPVSEGSSVGVSIPKNDNELKKAIDLAFSLSSYVMIEKFIKGRELSIPVIFDKSYPIVELVPNEGFYDYEHKYTDGITKHICPAPLTNEQKTEIETNALRIFKELGCKDYARIDFILSDDGLPYFIEINTLPGMTSLSLVPECAGVAGLSFGELLKYLDLKKK